MGAGFSPSAASAAELRELFDAIDRGVDSHISWNQRLLRTVLLHEAPSDDVLPPDAHELCLLGNWLTARRASLDELDAALVARVRDAHHAMHDAARTLCTAALAGRHADPRDLQSYGDAQSSTMHELNALRHVIVEATATRDELTGLPLRHGVGYAYALRQRDAHRSGAALWIAMIDIDHFKSVNDRHGHDVGDVTLRHVAASLQSRLRENDTLVRFGGDEFLGLFLVSETPGIELITQRMLDSLRREPLRVDDRLTLELTATIGVARAHRGEPIERVIQRADHALYQGKLQGRNRCVVALP